MKTHKVILSRIEYLRKQRQETTNKLLKMLERPQDLDSKSGEIAAIKQTLMEIEMEDKVCQWFLAPGS
jgi:hypothetical protein